MQNAGMNPVHRGDLARLKHALAVLDQMPGWMRQNTLYDARIVLAEPLFNSQQRCITNVVGELARTTFGKRNGLRLEPIGIHGPETVRRMMWDPAAYPDDWRVANWKLHQVVFQSGRMKLAGRAAIAAFFDIGEWDAGTIFELHTHPKTPNQIDVVSHRLAHLVRWFGG